MRAARLQEAPPIIKTAELFVFKVINEKQSKELLVEAVGGAPPNYLPLSHADNDPPPLEKKKKCCILKMLIWVLLGKMRVSVEKWELAFKRLY